MLHVNCQYLERDLFPKQGCLQHCNYLYCVICVYLFKDIKPASHSYHRYWIFTHLLKSSFFCNGEWDWFISCSFWFFISVYRNASDFCGLILYLATLLNSLISSSNFLVLSLGFSMYSIMSSVDESWFPGFEWRGKPSFHKHVKRSFPLGICMWVGPCVLCFKRNGPRDSLIRKNSKFPCKGFMHAHRSYHKMKGCLSPL